MRQTRFAGIMALSLIACFAVGQQQGAAAVSGSAKKLPHKDEGAVATLKGDQIKDLLIGNTISGIEDGESYVEYLREDGTLVGESPSGKYTGRWQIFDDQMCFLYDKDGEDADTGSPSAPKKTAKPEWDCNDVVVKGSEVQWQQDGETETSSLKQGNPNGL